MSYGRTVAERPNDPKAYCHSCTARLMIGEPVSSPSWSDHLRLTPEQHDLLLKAAVEYRDLCIEASEPESGVGFLDWVALDALGLRLRVPPFADGARAVTELGQETDRKTRSTTHRHPDPIPYVSLTGMSRT